MFSVDEDRSAIRSAALGLIFLAGLVVIFLATMVFTNHELRQQQQFSAQDENSIKIIKIMTWGFAAGVLWSFLYHFYNIAVDIERHLRELVRQGRVQPNQAEELQALGQPILNSNYQKSMSGGQPPKLRRGGGKSGAK